MLQFSRLTLMFPVVVLGTLLTSCLTDKGGESIPASSTPWADNVQEWYFLKSISGSEIMRTEEPCGEEFDYGPLRYRLRGDSLDLGWRFVEPVFDDEFIEILDLDTFWFGGTYTRTAGETGRVQGSWQVRRFGPWDTGAISQARADSLRDEWNFMFADEELRITNRVLTFAYPTVLLYNTRLAEYQLRNDDGVVFQYIGMDSLRITRDGETASLKHLPFKALRARSTNPARAVINVNLADSCTFANPAVDTSWIPEIIWGPEILPGDELEKKATNSRNPRHLRGR